MGLVTKTSFIKQDKSGREITIKDSTGIESLGIPTGYGIENGLPQDILFYYVSVSRIFDSLTYMTKIDGVGDNQPTPYQIAYGAEIKLTTDMFSDGPMDQPCIFRDGVLDINVYVEFLGYDNVVIQKDSNYIVGDDFEDAYKADSIIVNGVIYDIDKSKDNNGYTVLYVVGGFEEDADSFNILYRSNIKCLLTSMSEHYHDYACKVLRDCIDSPEWNKVNVAASFRRAALGLFNSEVPDYFAANDLMQSNIKLISKFAI